MSATSTDTAKKCGTCKHMQVLDFTPSGRPKKDKACKCNGVVTLVAPMSYRVDLHQSYVWPNNDASKCPTYEVKA